MSLRRRLLVLVAAFGAAAAVLPVLTGFASEETVSALGGGYGSYYWSPSSVSGVSPGASVNFQNTSMSVKHGIVWHSLPVGASAPSCDSTVPVHNAVGEGGEINWKGKCTFAHAGTYTFYCSVHGSEMTGTINVNAPGVPSALTDQQTEVTQTTATLNGTVKPEGNATSYYFAYGTTSAMTEKIPVSPQSVGNDFAEHAVSAALTNLLPKTEYHFRLIATYGASGKAEGVERTFSTPSLEKPKVTTHAVPKETEATLEGTIDPGGETTKYVFEYGTSTSYGQQTTTKTLSSPVGVQTVAASLTKLLPGTEYHFRLVATNGKGSGESLGSFTTASTPPAKEPTKEPPAKESSPTPTPTPTPNPISPEPEIAPLVPPLVESSLKLTAPRHGSSVRGSIEVTKSGAGGRLEVDLIANSASLAKARHKKSTSTVVGRLVRGSVSAGKVSFSIALNARAKSALRRHHKLALTAKVTLTPTQGKAVTITRGVVLHA